jgi:hypothetical protein
MQLWALVNPRQFQAYLEQSTLSNSPQTLQIYLSTIGTSSIRFQNPSDDLYREVPPGSCIQLRTEDQYKFHASHLIPKEDKSQRSSSCTIV